MFDKRSYMKDYRESIKEKRNQLMDSKLTPFCVACKESPSLLVAHRKDGASHEKFAHKNLEWVEKELDTGNYVRLCAVCHKGVHFCMEKMNMKWEEIRAAFV